MAKSSADSAPAAAAVADVEPGGYQHWSRDPAVGLFAVLPLWLLYEAARLHLAPAERNGAEVLLLHELHRLGSRAHLVLSIGFCLLLLGAARSLVRRDVPWLRVAAVIAPSYNGLYFRNAFNVGLLLLTCPQADLLQENERIMLEPQESSIVSALSGRLACEPVPDFLMAMVQAGGLFNQLKQRLAMQSAADPADPPATPPATPSAR